MLAHNIASRTFDDMESVVPFHPEIPPRDLTAVEPLASSGYPPELRKKLPKPLDLDLDLL